MKKQGVLVVDGAALGAVFTLNNSNGSKWAGEEPDSIETLIAVLGREALDPTFEMYGDFAYETPCKAAYDEKGKIIDGPPLFPEHTGVWAFFGNFANLSHVFNIYTNDPAVIEPLRAAIAKNKASDAYAAEKTRRAA